MHRSDAFVAHLLYMFLNEASDRYTLLLVANKPLKLVFEITPAHKSFSYPTHNLSASNTT
jgi:hypothetical protein